MGVRVMIFWGGFGLIRNLDDVCIPNVSYLPESSLMYVSAAESASEESVN